MSEKLKVCPFCGKGAYRDEFRVVRCSNPECPLFYGNGFDIELREDWNHRPVEAKLEQENERLRGRLNQEIAKTLGSSNQMIEIGKKSATLANENISLAKRLGSMASKNLQNKQEVEKLKLQIKFLADGIFPLTEYFSDGAGREYSLPGERVGPLAVKVITTLQQKVEKLTRTNQLRSAEIIRLEEEVEKLRKALTEEQKAHSVTLIELGNERRNRKATTPDGGE